MGEEIFNSPQALKCIAAREGVEKSAYREHLQLSSQLQAHIEKIDMRDEKFFRSTGESGGAGRAAVELTELYAFLRRLEMWDEHFEKNAINASSTHNPSSAERKQWNSVARLRGVLKKKLTPAEVKKRRAQLDDLWAKYFTKPAATPSDPDPETTHKRPREVEVERVYDLQDPPIKCLYRGTITVDGKKVRLARGFGTEEEVETYCEEHYPECTRIFVTKCYQCMRCDNEVEV